MATFNLSDVEGEVDHSFFDSDCDEKMEKDLKAEQESPPAPARPNAKQTENAKGGGIKKHRKPVNNNRTSTPAEMKVDSCQSKEEESNRASSTSSVACTSDKVINNSSDSEEDSTFSKRHNETYLLGEAGEVNYSPNESEDDALPSKHSDERSVDADSESSSISSDERSSLDSPTLPRPNKHLLSPGLRRARVGSAGSGEMPIGPTEESEDTLTDVSHLSSPDTSPLHSVDLNHTEATEEHQQESVPSSGLNDSQQVQDSDHDVDDCTLSSASRLGGKVVFCGPGGRNRKNYSFTNDEVKRIDRENQRLLRELSLHSSGPRPGSTVRKKSNMACKLPPTLLYHTALNRQREQQRIERENLAFLKRLNSVKPTPGLKRSEQLKDYQRVHGSCKTPSSPRPASSAPPQSQSSYHHY